MSLEKNQKVMADHLRRDAYLYVRQSTLRQVFENTESTKRQYGLRQQAVALGWPIERVVVIDSDLGQSGASAVDREGFQKLVTQVGLGKAGIVLGLEVSRLARNNADWHRLLEICALTHTLILDEDGLYDPCHFNDRLLLGLKGAMSEAELHVLHARLRGGIINKARRGELKAPLPVGLMYDSQDHVILDPDSQVQHALRTFFHAFEQTGTACATVKYFHDQGLLFPRRLRRGIHKGQLVWGPLLHSRTLQILHNPRYAGAFFHGRTRYSKDIHGRKSTRKLPPEEWDTLLPETHVGYISWQQYQRHQERLRENGQAFGMDRRKSPAGEGPALLQGLVVCGLCGQRMTVRYHNRGTSQVPDYCCQRDGIEHATRPCQSVPGGNVDQAIGDLLLEKMTPLTLEVALSVQQELQSRLEEADQLRRQQVERARYEADVARQRFMQVDPQNRFVADALEADWNEKLRAVDDAQQRCEQQSQADRWRVDQEAQAEILSLATDFPKLWRDPKTPDRERKRMVRLLIDDVTLRKEEGRIRAEVRFPGGTTQTLQVPLPLPAWAIRQTDPKVVAEIDRLLDQDTDAEIAARLNHQGVRSGEGHSFTRLRVRAIRCAYQLKSRYSRLRDAGMLTLRELAKQCGVCKNTIQRWRREGLLKAHAYNDKQQFLYEPLGNRVPIKHPGIKLSDSRRFSNVVPNQSNEV